MPEAEDFYEILQVHPSAHLEVIQAAYHRLAQLYHPDRNPYPDASARMTDINRAYEVLSNPTRRAEYDRSRGYGGQRGHAALNPVPDVIQARSFQVVDDNGRVRAELSTGLTVFDQNGTARLSAYVQDDGAVYLDILDENGKHRLDLGMDPDKNSRLSVWDQNRRKLNLVVDKEGTPELFMHDGIGNNSLWMGQADDGSPMVFITDDDGERRFEVNLDSDGRPTLYMSDGIGNNVLWMGQSNNGPPMLYMTDDDGERRFEVHLDSDGNPQVIR